MMNHLMKKNRFIVDAVYIKVIRHYDHSLDVIIHSKRAVLTQVPIFYAYVNIISLDTSDMSGGSGIVYPVTL